MYLLSFCLTSWVFLVAAEKKEQEVNLSFSFVHVFNLENFKKFHFFKQTYSFRFFKEENIFCEIQQVPTCRGTTSFLNTETCSQKEDCLYTNHVEPGKNKSIKLTSKPSKRLSEFWLESAFAIGVYEDCKSIPKESTFDKENSTSSLALYRRIQPCISSFSLLS